MEVGFFLNDFNENPSCIVLSAEKIANLEINKDYKIVYSATDGSLVSMHPIESEEGESEKSYIYIDASDIDQMINMARKLTESGHAGHNYIDTHTLPLIVSIDEYSWLKSI